MLEETIKVEDLSAPVLPEGHPVRFDAGGPFMFRRVIHFKQPSGNRPLEIVQESPELITGSLATDADAAVLEAQLVKAKADLERTATDPHVLNNLGSILLNKRHFEQARECFEQATALRPGFYEAQSNLAMTYLREGRPRDALDIYATALKGRPDDPRLLMNLAHAYLQLDELDRSSECLDRVIELDPGNASAFHNRGLLKMARKRWPEAVGDLRRATRLDVRFVDAYNALGVCYLLQGSLQKAERGFRAALALAPFNEDATINLALVLHVQDRHEEALTVVEEHLGRQPTDLAARFLQVALLMSLSRLAKCLKVLDKMEELTEEVPHASKLKPWVKFNRGILYEMKEDDRAAEGEYRDAIQSAHAVWEDPSPSVFFYASLALLYTRQDRLPEASELLERCEKECPEDPLVFIVLAMVQGKQGDWKEALRLAERAVHRDPDSFTLEYVRGTIYGKLGQYTQQIDCYRAALRMQPNSALVVNALAYAYLVNGDTERAREVLDDAQVDEPNPFLAATRGLLLIREGDLQEGRRLYNRAADMASKPELRNLIHQKKHLELGRKLLQEGDIARAQRELRKVQTFQTALQDYLNEALLLLDTIQSDQEVRPQRPGQG